MAQFLHTPLALGLSKGGLTLTAQLYDSAGVAVGGPITTGFVDHGSGAYSWYYAAYSDALAAAGGSVKFTGTGVNVSTSFNPADFGLTNALSATAIATAVWASGTRTLSSFGTLVADTAAAVWAYATRTLTMTAAEIVAALTSSATITFHRGDTCVINLTGLGNLADRDKLWLTVKESVNDTDDQSILQFEETAGLLRLNGAAPVSAAHGSLVVTNPVTGAVTITLKPAASKELELASRLVYDVQQLVGTDTYSTPTRRAVVEEDATRAVS